MARKDALDKIKKALLSRRAELFAQVTGELSALKEEKSSDALDDAFKNASGDVLGRLAQMEAQEINSIDHALDKIKDNSYGSCERCEKKIPVERLEVLPYTPFCVGCQSVLEKNGYSPDMKPQEWRELEVTGGPDRLDFNKEAQQYP